MSADPGLGLDDRETARRSAPRRDDEGGSRGGRGIWGIAQGVLIVVLVIALLWVLSILNTRRYGIEVSSGQVTILKGIRFPWGMSPWQPDDPELAAAYAPVALPADPPTGIAGLGRRTYTEFTEMSAAFFDILAGLASATLYRGAGRNAPLAEMYLNRAQQISGLDAGRSKSLRHLRGDLAYVQADELLQGIEERLRKAATLLKTAEELGTERFKDVSFLRARVDMQLAAISSGGPRRLPSDGAPAREDGVGGADGGVERIPGAEAEPVAEPLR
jgi:hypothetical protein